MPRSNIWALLESCRAQKQTGVIALGIEDDQAQVLFLKRGEVINAGLTSPQSYEKLPIEAWRAKTESMAEAQARWIPLSAQGTLMVKLLLQNPGGNTETVTQAGELDNILTRQQKTADVTQVKLEWDSALGTIVYCGAPEACYSLHLSAEAAQEQTGILPSILAPAEPICRVTITNADPAGEAWQEYLLRRAFADICEGVLVQFRSLAGRALVDSLLRLTQVFISRRNLNIHFTANKVVDDEFFSSPQEAAENYRSLLTEVLVHSAGITGSRLLASTLWEIFTTLPDQERTVIEAFSFLRKGYAYERNR